MIFLQNTIRSFTLTTWYTTVRHYGDNNGNSCDRQVPVTSPIVHTHGRKSATSTVIWITHDTTWCVYNLHLYLFCKITLYHLLFYVVQVYIQGPYGTPSTATFTADHAVLISGGIGVTPFASIIQSIVSTYRRFQTSCPNCHHTWTRDIPLNVLKIKKV